MCLGIPGLVTGLEPDGRFAWAEVSGARRRVNVELLADHEVQPGDWVLIHVGFALALLDEDEARGTLEILEGMEAAYTDELAAMARSAVSGPLPGTPEEVASGPPSNGTE